MKKRSRQKLNKVKNVEEIKNILKW